MSCVVRALSPCSALCLVLGLAGGCGVPSFLITPVSSSTKLQERTVLPGKSGDKVAIIEVEGMLANMRSGGLLQPTENKVSLFKQQMRAAARDGSVKAVILRINSPGGTVTASDTMYEIVRDFRRVTKKPVIASTQEVCASGAYYIACAADTIVAHPTSVVGSIGVMFSTMEFEGALGKLGVRAESIKSGPLKDMGSPFKSLSRNERAVMQEMVDEYFQRFVAIVDDARPVTEPRPAMPLESDYGGVYSGRVFSGERAVELGLADRTGRLEDAIKLAREAGTAKGAKVIMYKRPYGYGGSIYSSAEVPLPRAGTGTGTNVLRLEWPESRAFLPGGFYYLWEP
jgi:protease-4